MFLHLLSKQDHFLTKNDIFVPRYLVKRCNCSKAIYVDTCKTLAFIFLFLLSTSMLMIPAMKTCIYVPILCFNPLSISLRFVVRSISNTSKRSFEYIAVVSWTNLLSKDHLNFTLIPQIIYTVKLTRYTCVIKPSFTRPKPVLSLHSTD